MLPSEALASSSAFGLVLVKPEGDICIRAMGWEGEWRRRARYWLADHPRVAKFRWDHDEWGSTWVFLVMSILLYLVGILVLNLALRNRKTAIPLGPIPAIHNSMVIIGSVGVFLGCCQATVVEMESGWVWRRARGGDWNWVLCFPLGTRPSGRVFFWSYLFYLTKYHQLLHTAIRILQRKPLSFLHVFHRVFVVFMGFVWLEFSQSMQVVAILGNTVISAVIYFYELCGSVGLRRPLLRLPSPAKCQMAEGVFTGVAYAALLSIHFGKREGCNGMGAWLFNALLNAALLLFFLRSKGRPSPPSSPTVI